jgi:hypothetical protein
MSLSKRSLYALNVNVINALCAVSFQKSCQLGSVKEQKEVHEDLHSTKGEP